MDEFLEDENEEIVEEDEKNKTGEENTKLSNEFVFPETKQIFSPSDK
jgi:hypothetical protein